MVLVEFTFFSYGNLEIGKDKTDVSYRCLCLYYLFRESCSDYKCRQSENPRLLWYGTNQICSFLLSEKGGFRVKIIQHKTNRFFRRTVGKNVKTTRGLVRLQ